ncbi:MAG: hypothetical protein R2726_23205 [Acidimicrobiales bacterium]
MGRSFNVPLPDSISLEPTEVLLLLDALDLAEDPSIPQPRRAAARAAIKLLTRKMWEELGDILDEAIA